MQQLFKIEIESKGDYDLKKEFNSVVSLNEREYLALVAAILDYLEKIPKDTTPIPPEKS